VRRIYLDNNATTAIVPEVLQAMAPFLGGASGNASSLHQEGRQARRAIESAREQIAELLDAAPRQVIFTSGGTESNNLAVFSLAGDVPGPIATSTIEHPSIQACFDVLNTRGFPVHRIPVDESGLINKSSFRGVLELRPRLISVMLANNETGSIQPIRELAAAARASGLLFHTDAVQAVGKVPVSFRSLGVSSLSLSAHKFHGPVGVGALVVESPKGLHPLFRGGHQEFGLRAGTEPAAQIVGMARAMDLAVKNLDLNTGHIRDLAERFVDGLKQSVGPVIVNGSDCRLPHTINLQFPGVEAQAAVVALDLDGLACSTGSACSSGAPTLSPTLLAMGLDNKQARSSIRFSLSHLTTEQEIMRAVEIVSSVIVRLRRTPAFSSSI
jgi:cysteine desulfurase